MRYVTAVLGVLAIFVVVLILIIGRSPNGSTNTTQNATSAALTEYANKPSTVIFTTRGQVNGDDRRRGIRISVTSSQRTLQILDGYNEYVSSQQTFANNSNAYTNFLSALQVAGFAKTRSTNITDDSGVCPLGRRYDYKLQEGANEVFRTWNTSCGTRLGSFGGTTSTVQRLFQNQITNYSQIVQDVQL